MEVHIHIPLAPDLRGRIFAATGVAAPNELVVAVDPRDLDRAERVHLLRMAASNTTQWLSLYHAPCGAPPTDVWVGEYSPDPGGARVQRDPRRLSLDAPGDDAVVVAAALAACGAAEEGAADVAAPNAAVAAAAVRADRLRWEAAQETARRRLDAAVDEWIDAAEARAADLRARGAAALTPYEIEHGAAVAPRKPLWFDAVAAADARGVRLEKAWDALHAAWQEAYAQVVAARERAAQAAAQAAQAAQERRRAEMTAWIAAHGSDRLRALLEDGYPVRSLYAWERTAREFPGFVPDIDGRARWRALGDVDDAPTDAQIALARRVGGRVALLMYTTRGYPCGKPAVVIDDPVIGAPLIEAAVDTRDDDDE